MFNKLLGIAVFAIPMMISLPASNAQSWKDWSKQNPTYPAPAVSPSVPSPTVTPSPTPTETPATFSTPAPRPSVTPTPSSGNSGNAEYYSTQNPLFVQGFMAECERQQLPDSYCQCSLKEIQNNYTFDEMVQIFQFAEENGEIPSEIMTLALKCFPG